MKLSEMERWELAVARKADAGHLARMARLLSSDQFDAYVAERYSVRYHETIIGDFRGPAVASSDLTARCIWDRCDDPTCQSAHKTVTLLRCMEGNPIAGAVQMPKRPKTQDEARERAFRNAKLPETDRRAPDEPASVQPMNAEPAGEPLYVDNAKPITPAVDPRQP